MKPTKKQSEEKAYKEYIEKMNPEKEEKTGYRYRLTKGNMEYIFISSDKVSTTDKDTKLNYLGEFQYNEHDLELQE